MKDKTFLFIFLFVVTKCLCQNTNGCTNIDTDQIDWTAGLFQQFINDNEILNLNFSYTGNLEINFPESSESGTKYLNVIKSGDQVIFQTTDEFSKLEEDEEAPAPSGNQILLSRTVNFTCDGGTAKIAFILFVSDTNNHDPTFDKDTYSYEIPNPIPPKIDLTGFGNQITVTDFDFTNTDVSFTIDSKDFETSTTKLDSFRKYDLVLKAKQYKYLSEDTTLTLTATDSGTPPRSKTAQIQIKIDKDTSLPDIPTVPEVSYEFNYSLDNDGKPVLEPVGADIVVTTSDAEKTTVKLEGDFASSFDATFDKTSKVVTISTKDTPIDNSPKPVLVLTLVITLNDKTEDSSKTVILINLPKDKVIGIPQFNLPYYTAQYTANPDPNIDSVKLDTEISLSEEADVTLEGDLADHFSIDKNKQIQVVKDLDEDIIKEGEEILLILHAKVTEDGNVYEGFATLVVQFPEAGEAPKFTKPYYSANYVLSTDGSLDTLDMSETIALTSPNSKVDVKLVDYLDNFDLTYDSKSGNYNLTVKANLGKNILEEKDDIVVNFKATLSGFEDVESVVIITLPDIEIPKFSEHRYIGKYEIGKNTVMISGAPISVTPQKDITVNFNEVNENFEIDANSANPGQYIITVTKPLEISDLIKGEPIVLTIQANISGWKTVATSILVIELPEVTLKFAKSYYEATYSLDDNNNPKVDLTNGPIDLTSNVSAEIKFIEKYSESFDFDFKSNPQITVKKDLDNDTISKNQEILLTLQVSSKASTNTETTIIALKLPSSNTPKTLKFNQPSYVFSYKTDKTEPYIDTGNQAVTLDVSGAQIKITGTYAKNFEMVEGTDNTYTLSIKEKLDQTVLDTQPDLLLVLDASLDNYEDGFATILLNLPVKDAGIGPKFAQTAFSAIYSLGENTDTVIVDGEGIKLQSGTTEATVELTGTHSDHFNVAVNDDKTGYDLKLVKNLDHTVLISEADIVLTLQATIDDSVGEASLVVKLPKTTPPARFTKGYYLADYNMDSDKHKLVMKDNIELEGDFLAETEVVLEVDDELKEYFTFTPNPPTITLNNNLDEKILAEEHEVILGLSATLDKVSVRSTVVIAIPDLPTAPNFIKVTYTGSYDKENLAVKLDDDLETDAKDPTSVEITVEDPYVSNFDVKYNSTAKCYTVKVLNPLDDDTVDKEDEIYVALDATVDRAVTHSSATLVLKMPKKTSDIVPKFSEAHYRATYYENKSVVVTTPIVITSDQADSTEINVVKDYVDNFKMAKDGTTWGITVLKELDTTSDKEIVLTLEASLSGSTEKSEATLIMDLPNQELKPTPRFTKAYYEAEYKDETVNVTSDQITIPSAEKEIVEVTLDDTYKDYFGVSRNKNNKTQWDLDVVKPLDNNILDENTELILTLTSHLDHSESDDVATLLIKLPEHEEEFITFDKAYYSATYKVVDKDTDTVDSPKITVSSGATVSVIKDYADNFQVDNCKDNKCTLTVKTDLSEEVLNTRNEVIVVLQATKTGIAEKITAPVVVTLPLQETIEAPQFDNIAYSADYNFDDNTVSDNTIKVKETDISQIDVTIDSSSEYKDNFAIEQVGDHWRVKVKKALDVKDQVSISLILQATKTGVSVSGQAVFVVNLPAKQESTVVKFSEVTYSGHYTVKNPLDEVTIDQTIKIEGITDVSEADVVIEPNTAEDLSTYFEVKPETDHWTLNVIKDLPSNILDEEVSILLTLKATLKETKTSGEVGVVITLPKKITPTSFYFDGTVYNAEYKNDDKPSIKVDLDITIKEDADYSAQVSLTGENSDYFSSSYSKGKVSITLKKALPDDTVKDKSAISLVIVAKKNDEEAKATLVVQLPKEKGSGGDDDDSSSDQTGLIAAVAVLAVLLVAAIVGSGVFYYFKFRAAKNYNNTTTESPRPSERFRKNSNGIESKNKFEHPTRRPTGVIKYPLVDVSAEEEAEVTPIDKRKSVQFDVVHIDELEIESEKPDDDENDNTYENVEADRRNSEA